MQWVVARTLSSRLVCPATYCAAHTQAHPRCPAPVPAPTWPSRPSCPLRGCGNRLPTVSLLFAPQASPQHESEGSSQTITSEHIPLLSGPSSGSCHLQKTPQPPTPTLEAPARPAWRLPFSMLLCPLPRPAWAGQCCSDSKPQLCPRALLPRSGHTGCVWTSLLAAPWHCAGSRGRGVLAGRSVHPFCSQPRPGRGVGAAPAQGRDT